MKKGKVLGLLAVGVLGFGLAACSKSDSDSSGKTTITFINHKTDWQTDGTWKKYMAEFNKKYPDVTVKIETITDYAGQMKTRMNSKDYGDLLMLPTTINPKDYKNFFVELGKTSKLSDTYMGLTTVGSYEDKQYGLPSQMNASGLVVNWEVFTKAGITEFPKTPEDFITDLQQIKKKEPDVTPLYTNYAAGWTLSNWDFVRQAVAGDPNYDNDMVSDKSPFEEGKPLYTIYDTLFKTAENKLIEKDPTTSDWEQSKVDMANGKIGVMALGSWAIPQIQAANEDNADNIQFQPFPTNTDGKQYLLTGADYEYAINKNSSKAKQKAARELMDWLLKDSKYAQDNGGLSAVKGSEYPDSLKAAQDAGVELMEPDPAPAGKESLFSDINNESELGIGTTDTEKQRIIDAAIGNSDESFADIMKDFNSRWAAGVEKYNM
ncbi:ABC transporter substrate-binding protein [Lactovum odontotermitis]